MKFTNNEVDILIEILDDEVSERSEEPLDEYYDNVADLTQAITQLHFSNKIENPSIREKVKSVMKDRFILKIENVKSLFINRNRNKKGKTKRLSFAKIDCEDAANYLGILIKLEAQDGTE